MADKRDFLINLLGRETVSPAAKKAAAGIEDVADEMKDTARAAETLDRRIDELNRSLAQLAVQSALTGDDDSLTRQMRDQQRELRRLTKDRSLIGSMAKLGVEAGAAAGKSTVKSFGEALGALPAQVKGAGIVAGVVLGAAMAPAIGAAVSGAVLTGVGAGTIGAGVALAFQDPQVKKAAEGLGAQVKASFTSAASGFVVPVLTSLKLVGESSDRIAGQAKGAFNDLAPLVTNLTKGVLGLAENAMPGFRSAVKAAAPIIRTLSRELPELGSDISYFFKKISGESDGATMAIHGMVEVIGGSIRTLGDILAWLSDKFEKMVNFQAEAAGRMEDVWGWVPFVGDRIRAANDSAENLQQGLKESGDASADTAGDFALLAGKASTAAVEVETLAEMIDRLAGENLDARAANRNLEAAIDDATAAVKENGRTLDESTPKGRANAEALDAIARTAKQSAAAILTQTGSTELASVATEKGRAAFIRAAGAMGVEKAEAIALANKLFGLPDDVTTNAHFNPDNTGVKRWKTTLSGIPRHIFIKAHFDLINDREVSMALRLGRLAHGGPVEGPGPKGVDSVPILAAPGEHVLTAREVDAAGGHKSIERWRKSLTGGGERAATSVLARPAMSSGGGGNTYITLHAGVIGSSMELENWLTRSVDSLRRKGRM